MGVHWYRDCDEHCDAFGSGPSPGQRVREAQQRTDGARTDKLPDLYLLLPQPHAQYILAIRST